MIQTQTLDEKNELKLHIESLRNEMILTGLNEGFTSERTIIISKRLDEYITKYQLLRK